MFDDAVNFFRKYPEIEEPFVDTDMEDHDNEILKKGMEQISQRCRNLLLQRHFHNKSVSQLKETFHYANENTVSVTLHKCLKNLKEAIEKLENGE